MCIRDRVLRDEIGIDIKYDEATLNNYKVVKPGQFVIHLRSFQGGFALSKDVYKRQVYEDKEHMLEVLDAILNKSYQQLGFPNGVGKTYEAILTVKSIPQAQAYYNLLKSIKEGQERVKVSERVKRVLPDFPKVTVTYSVSENEEESIGYQEHMKQVMDDYNQEYGTHFNMADLRGYNTDINNRLARKLDKYIPRNEQLDLVIVVDRLLTGFDLSLIHIFSGLIWLRSRILSKPGRLPCDVYWWRS